MKGYVEALLYERAGYVAKERPARANDVAAELKRAGYNGPEARPLPVPGAPETTRPKAPPETATPPKPA